MTRKKVKLVWIVNDTARKASLKKRRVGLLKKVSELTTLCGVNAFVVIFGPEDKDPAMWPSRPVVQQLLARFHNLPEMERYKKMTNQETYLRERVTKVQDQTKKHHRRNKEIEVSHLMGQIYHANRSLDDFNLFELHGLAWFADEKKKETRKRIEYCQQVHPLSPEASLSSPHHLSGPVDSKAQAGDGRSPTEPVLLDQWFVNMMNNGEHIAGSSTSSRAKSDAGLGLTSHQAFAASSTAAYQTGFSGNLRVYNISSDMGLPHGNITTGGSSSKTDTGLGLLLDDNFSIGANIDTDINLGLQHGNSGASSNAAASGNIGLTADLFGGSVAGIDVGLPYDVTKEWPNNFFP